jgi:hypothetical protein
MTVAACFARDAGAANHVVAVVDLIAGRLDCPAVSALIAQLAGGAPRSTNVWGLGPALKVFASAGITAREESPRDIAAARSLLDEAGARLLVTGTGDVDDRTTPLFWVAASQQGIPSVAVLDSADNMQVRFDLAKGERPDRIVAPDSRAVARLHELGVLSSDIVLAENLHHARLAKLPPPERRTMRLAWDVNPDARVVLFASENAAEARAMGRSVDFDEFALLASLIDDIEARRSVGPLTIKSEEVVIVVRPHPRDLPGKYDRYARAKEPRVVVSAAGTPGEAISGADLIVGMRSALLDEAHIIGRPVHRLVKAHT